MTTFGVPWPGPWLNLTRPTSGSAANVSRLAYTAWSPTRTVWPWRSFPLRRTNVGFLAYELAPVMLLVVLSVGTLGIGWLTAADIGSGALPLLRTTAAPSLAIAAGRVAAALVVVGVVVAPLVVEAALSQHLGPARLAVVCALVLLTAAVGVGLGLVVALIFRRPPLVAMASTALCSYLFFLGGGFTTIAFLPSWLQTISGAVPTRYAIDGLRQVLFYAAPQHVTTDLAVLGAVATVSLVVAAAGDKAGEVKRALLIVSLAVCLATAVLSGFVFWGGSATRSPGSSLVGVTSKAALTTIPVPSAPPLLVSCQAQPTVSSSRALFRISGRCRLSTDGPAQCTASGGDDYGAYYG